MRDTNSPLYKHDLMAAVVVEYLARLKNSFACWQNRLAFTDTFKISRAECGFPVFQNVLELEKDQQAAKDRLQAIPSADQLRADMADFILRKKEFPLALQKSMAERIYLEEAQKGRFVPALYFAAHDQGCGEPEDDAAVLCGALGRCLTGQPICRWFTRRRSKIRPSDMVEALVTQRRQAQSG